MVTFEITEESNMGGSPLNSIELPVWVLVSTLEPRGEHELPEVTPTPAGAMLLACPPTPALSLQASAFLPAPSAQGAN